MLDYDAMLLSLDDSSLHWRLRTDNTALRIMNRVTIGHSDIERLESTDLYLEWARTSDDKGYWYNVLAERYTRANMPQHARICRALAEEG